VTQPGTHPIINSPFLAVLPSWDQGSGLCHRRCGSHFGMGCGASTGKGDGGEKLNTANENRGHPQQEEVQKFPHLAVESSSNNAIAPQDSIASSRREPPRAGSQGGGMTESELQAALREVCAYLHVRMFACVCVCVCVFVFV